MANLTSTLTIKLIDDASAPAQAIARALREAEARAQALANSGASNRLQQRLASLGASAGEIAKVSAAWKDYASANNLAASASDWTKAQASAVRAWENSVVSSIRAVRREQDALARAQAQAAEATARARQASSDKGLFGVPGRAGLLGMYAAYRAQHAGRATLETYREFDKERRFGGAVMGLSADEMEPLIKQAIHLGGSTKYNDIQVLEAQRELAARGLNKDQILGAIPAAARFGMAMDLSLPEAVRQLEGSLFGFARDMSTTAKTADAVARTADMQVKAAKISGMKPEDLTALYKFGATPSRLAGLDESLLLAFGGVLKKSNIGGDEAGVAFRQMMARMIAPTRDAKEALLASGLNFKDYQKTPEAGMNTQAFAQMVAARYGVGLQDAALKGLDKIFHDEELLADPAKFTPAVTALLKGVLKGNDAKSLKSIASAANHFRDTSMQGVDVNKLLTDLLHAMSTREDSAALQLANTFFGPKQGGRIVSALKNDPIFRKYVEDIVASSGYSEKIAGERMSGFDGAVSRLQGSLKNLETAIGRAWDNNGKGGPLTAGTDRLAAFAQALAEANSKLQMLASGAAGVAALWAGAKGLGLLTSGFGLKGSAIALDSAAAALTRAAGALAAGGAGKGLPGLAGAGTAGAGAAGLAATRLKGGAVAAGIGALEVMKRDAEGGNSVRSWLREALGIDDPKEPAPWKPGGAFRYDATGENGATGPGSLSDIRKRLGLPEDAAEKAAAAGQQTGASFHEGLKRELEAAVQTAQDAARRIIDSLSFSASPTVTPKVAPAAAPAAKPDQHSSASDWLRGGHADYGFDLG